MPQNNSMLCYLFFNLKKGEKNKEINLIASKTESKENTHSFQMYMRIWSMC